MLTTKAASRGSLCSPQHTSLYCIIQSTFFIIHLQTRQLAVILIFNLLCKQFSSLLFISISSYFDIQFAYLSSYVYISLFSVSSILVIQFTYANMFFVLFSSPCPWCLITCIRLHVISYYWFVLISLFFTLCNSTCSVATLHHVAGCDVVAWLLSSPII